ncbi:MAG: alpha/beta fold hydrolase [Planctomycetes bacterium]|nr:alpha/beta fold hydrolase [Planctomycetota bacterium]
MKTSVSARLLAPLCLAALLATPAFSEVTFRRHVLNADSQFSSAAVMDVNHDGKPDIVSGGFWYEGPTWKRHFLREVQMIRGRYDDYSNLPLDVNGDGWQDIVSVNYRSKSLYWVEHPGRSLSAPWKRHVIDTPGPSETGRLADVDGDGRIDVLPNGTSFAAWWEVLPGEKGNPPRWTRHDLPKELIGHGLGFGDINGDGRNDLVSPLGWLEAPNDRRRDRWIWHAEFELDRRCSIPILVTDVDGDGDADLVWGRGHGIGVYWTEQVRDAKGKRTWRQHAIDTSWSQPHTMLLADIDGDGRDDLVAGKRYLGHDGKDRGEYDPLVIYWYKFDRATKVWRRGLISWGGTAGFDLDPAAADLDGDGDIDIVAATRVGLHWFENLRINKAGVSASDVTSRPKAPQYADHSKPLVYKDADGKQHPVRTPFDLARRRWHILAGMQQAMGTLPDPSRRVPLDVKVLSVEDTPRYVRKKITYQADPGGRVPAFLLLPKDIKGKAPAMLCLHPTSPLGKAQIAGLGGKPSRFYAHELANRGYVCLVPDYPSFGDYAKYDFKAASRHYQSGTMKAIWDNIRGVDLLEAMPQVNSGKIGCIGHSLGGHNALFTAAFDQRLSAVVTSCGFTAFGHYYQGNLKGWTSDRYMPRIRDVYGNDPSRVPFDFYEVLAAIAPRPVFVNAPLGDSNFEVGGVKKVMAVTREVYKIRGAQDRLKVVYPDCGHDFPADVRESVYKWLDELLKK